MYIVVSTSFTLSISSFLQVPRFRPQATFHFLSKFLASERLSPLLLHDKALAKLDEDEFIKILKHWIKIAQSPPYVLGAISEQSSSGGAGGENAAETVTTGTAGASDTLD